MFLKTLINVIVILAYAAIGFILIKSKLMKKEAIPGIATILMYICAPAMVIDAFTNVELSKDAVITMLIFFGIVTLIQILFIGICFIILKRKYDDPKYRIYTIASGMSNCAFFGIPLIKSLLPDYPMGVALSCVYFISMNLLGWTMVSAIIANDKKYINIKKMILNPAIISGVIALVLYGFSIKLPPTIGSMVDILGKMTTPLSMIVLGARMATVPLKQLFNDYRVYIVIAIKQLAMPLFTLLVVWFLPLDFNFKVATYIFCGCPVAAVVLNYSELIGEGQETACKTVILGTLFSIITLPLLVLFF